MKLAIEILNKEIERREILLLTETNVLIQNDMSNEIGELQDAVKKFELSGVVKRYNEEEIEQAYDKGHENGYRRRMIMKNDFNYKWSKLFASKRYKWSKLFASKRYNTKDGVIKLTPEEQQELLDDSERVVKNLSLSGVGSSNKIDYKKGFDLAIKYLEESPCDPDIYKEQLKAWNELNNFIKEKKDK